MAQNGIDTYVIRGVTANGDVRYYTGRAGDHWLSASITEAFGYQSLEGARAKAKNMNRMTGIHGVWFTVPWIREYLEQSHMDPIEAAAADPSNGGQF